MSLSSLGKEILEGIDGRADRSTIPTAHEHETWNLEGQARVENPLIPCSKTSSAHREFTEPIGPQGVNARLKQNEVWFKYQARREPTVNRCQVGRIPACRHAQIEVALHLSEGKFSRSARRG